MEKRPAGKLTQRHRKQAERVQAIAEHLASNDAEQDRTAALQMARAIALAALPRKKTSNRYVLRTFRLGQHLWVRVEYSTSAEGVLPYGDDRFVLAGIQHLALERKSPVVYFEHVSELLKMFERSTDGRSLRRLRDRFKRLADLYIRLRFAETEKALPDAAAGDSILMIRGFSLPTRQELRNELRIEPIRRRQLALPGFDVGTAQTRYGVLLSADFWEHLKEPQNLLLLPLDLMRLFVNQPAGWDYAAFLVHRCSRAQTTSVVPHEALMSLFKDGPKERESRVIDLLLKYHDQIMNATGGRLNAALERVGYFPTSKRGGRPKERWQLRIGPSKQIIWSGKKDELLAAPPQKP
jgi:hypothetical protein